jgi:hypothetical protein
LPKLFVKRPPSTFFIVGPSQDVPHLERKVVLGAERNLGISNQFDQDIPK